MPDGRDPADDICAAGGEPYRAIVETAGDAIVTIADDGRILVANPAAERMFGRPAAEMVGRDVSLLMTAPIAAAHGGHLAGYRDDGSSRVVDHVREVEAVRADGSVFPAHLSVGVMRVGGRRMFTGVFRDLSDLRAVERELARERDHHAGILAAMSDGLLVVTPEGPIVEVNEAFCRLAGMTREEVLAVTERPHPWHAEPEVTQAELARFMESGSGSTEFLFRHSSGATTPVQVSVNARRGPDGAIEAFVCTLRDVGPLRRAEQERRDTEARLAVAREAGRMKDEFLATFSHEMRTPLSAVLGYQELALADCTEPGVRELLEVAQRNGHRMSELVADLLLLGRAAAGRLALDEEPLDLAGLVHEAVAAARPGAEARDVSLEADVPHAAPVVGDAERLGQVIANLIGHAVARTPLGGRVRVGLARGGDRARVSVADEGPGIPADEHGRVFEPFRRDTGGPEGGTGLALAVAKALAEAHGGAVGVSAGHGRGSVLHAEWPLSPESAPA